MSKLFEAIQHMTEYVHKVHGTASAMVRNPDGSIREATPEELERLRKLYEVELARSFGMSAP